MMAGHAAPPGRYQQIDGTVAVDIAESNRVEAERVSRRAARKCPQEPAVSPRIQIGAPCGFSDLTVLPRSHDEIVAPVAVHIARDRWTGAETFAHRLPGKRQQPLAGSPGMDVDPSG
jgi:hypothetical protein